MYLILMWICSCAGSVVVVKPSSAGSGTGFDEVGGGPVVFLCLDFQYLWWDSLLCFCNLAGIEPALCLFEQHINVEILCSSTKLDAQSFYNY